MDRTFEERLQTLNDVPKSYWKLKISCRELARSASERLGEIVMLEPQIRGTAFLLGYYSPKGYFSPWKISTEEFQEGIRPFIPEESQIVLRERGIVAPHKWRVAYTVSGVRTAFEKIEDGLYYNKHDFERAVEAVI
jgi:hypothetical protein